MNGTENKTEKKFDDLRLVPQELKDLVPGYLERRQRDIFDLRGMLTAHDYEAMKGMGHRLKGSGLSYGFPTISDMGAEIEAGAKTKDPKRIRIAVEDLAATVTRLQELLAYQDV